MIKRETYLLRERLEMGLKIKIWNTKYCLSSGITEHKVEPLACESDNGMILIDAEDRLGSDYYLIGEGKDWHKSKELAVIRAEEVKVKKLKSLQKQIKKIEALVF